MTNEERAVELVKKIERLIFKDYCNQDGVKLILTHDDEIRRECAEIAETIVSESLYDGSGYYQVDIPFMKSAIMKKD